MRIVLPWFTYKHTTGDMMTRSRTLGIGGETTAASGVALRDYYSDVLPQRYLSPHKTYRSYSKVRIDLDSRMIIYGGTGSGKTHALLNIIDAMGCWDTVTLIARTLNEPLYEYLIDRLDKDVKARRLKWAFVSD